MKTIWMNIEEKDRLARERAARLDKKWDDERKRKSLRFAKLFEPYRKKGFLAGMLQQDYLYFRNFFN